MAISEESLTYKEDDRLESVLKKFITQTNTSLNRLERGLEESNEVR